MRDQWRILQRLQGLSSMQHRLCSARLSRSKYTYRSLAEQNSLEAQQSIQDFEAIASNTHQKERVIKMLTDQRGLHIGAQVDLFQHGLQSATRAHRAGEDDELVVCALLHDIGELITPQCHGEIAASILRPYISPKNHWILAHHEIFQAYYWSDDPNVRDSREAYKNHEHYEACVTFCEQYDQTSFDPDYDSLPLEFFEPMVSELLSRKPYASIDHEQDKINSSKKLLSGGYPQPSALASRL